MGVLDHFHDAILVSLGTDNVTCDRSISQDMSDRICREVAPLIGKTFTGNMNENVRDHDWMTWHDIVFRLTRRADPTNYKGITSTGCSCGSFPEHFFRLAA